MFSKFGRVHPPDKQGAQRGNAVRSPAPKLRFNARVPSCADEGLRTRVRSLSVSLPCDMGPQLGRSRGLPV